MASFEFTSPEGKKYTVAGPDGATKEQAFQMLQTQLKVAKPSSLSDQIPGNPGANTKLTVDAPESTWDKIKGAGEAALAMGTGIVGGTVGTAAGTAHGVGVGIQNMLRKAAGLPEGERRQLEDYAAEGQNALTYQPRTQTGNRITQAIGNAMNDSGIIAVAPMAGEATALNRTVAPAKNALRDAAGAGAANVADVSTAGVNKLTNLVKRDQPAMSGVGAADTGAVAMRMQNAANLPIPPKLTKSQVTRNAEDVQFEREAAKRGKEGQPIRDVYAAQNKNLEQNIDAYADQTGAVETKSRSIGQAVDKAVRDSKAVEDAKTNAQYAKARAAGEMQSPIDVTQLVDYLNENRSVFKNAPVLQAIESEIKRLGKKQVDAPNSVMNNPAPTKITMSLDNTENIRQMINRLSEDGTPNVPYGIGAKKIIDAATEGQGGPEFRQARRMYENTQNQFENRGVIKNLLSNKPGTADRSVAFEDVLDHLVGKSASRDDVSAVRRTLMTAGEDGSPERAAGLQAWKEVQGGLIKRIRDKTYGNISNDETGMANASPAKLDRFIKDLDEGGKLDFIYGKQGAQKLRDLNEHAKTIMTTPPGTVNFSNSSSAFIAALAGDIPLAAMTGFPAPLITAATYAAKRVKANQLQKKIQSHLNYLEQAAQ